MIGSIRKIEQWIGTILASCLSQTALRTFALRLAIRDPQALLEAFGPHLNRKPNLDNMAFDLPVKETLEFEQLAGLFSSTSLDHAVITMTVRQAAYLFGLIRHMEVMTLLNV